MNKFVEWLKSVKPFFTLNIPVGAFGIVLGAGWYRGEIFKLLSVSLFEILDDLEGKIDYISILDIHILKFAVYVGISL